MSSRATSQRIFIKFLTPLYCIPKRFVQYQLCCHTHYCKVMEKGAVDHLFNDTQGDFRWWWGCGCWGTGKQSFWNSVNFAQWGCFEISSSGLLCRRWWWPSTMFPLQLKTQMNACTRNGILFHIVIADFVMRAMSSQHWSGQIRRCTPYWDSSSISCRWRSSKPLWSPQPMLSSLIRYRRMNSFAFGPDFLNGYLTGKHMARVLGKWCPTVVFGSTLLFALFHVEALLWTDFADSFIHFRTTSFIQAPASSG